LQVASSLDETVPAKQAPHPIELLAMAWGYTS